MTTMNFQQLHDLAAQVGFADPDTAAAIAIAESRGQTGATNIVTQEQADEYNATHPTGPRHGPERSFGLWQVNTLVWTAYSETQLLDATYNAQAAFAVFKAQGFKAWSTYTSGDYKAYLPKPSPDPVAVGSSASGTVVATLLLAGVTYLVIRHA